MQLLKKILFATVYVFIGIFILSIIFYVLDSKEICSWCNFVFNWLVGTGCSIIVVIITTFIEFKYRQCESFRELGDIIWVIIMNFNSLDKLELPDELNEDYNNNHKLKEIVDRWKKQNFDNIVSNIIKLNKEISGIEFIFHKKEHLSLLKLVNRNKIQLINKRDVKKEIKEITDIVLELTKKKNYYWKEELIKFKNKE